MLYIGTSGWSYKHWGTTFYPTGLVARDQLKFLARHFATVELNASFYHLPLATSITKWYADTPPDFRFSVKVTRIITHNKRLADVETDWQQFLERATGLGEKLGILLLQFPPSFRATEETLGRFDAFLTYAKPGGFRLAFELRHATWFEAPALEIFTRQKACVVQADSSRYPHTPPGFAPAEYTYYRFHGPRQLYASQYTDEELAGWAEQMIRDQAAGKDVYAYFDNDFHGYAVEDARRLRDLLA